MDFLLALLGFAVGFLLCCAWQILRARNKPTPCEGASAHFSASLRLMQWISSGHSIEAAGGEAPRGSAPLNTMSPASVEKEKA